MHKPKTSKLVSLLLTVIMALGSMQAIVWANEPQDMLPLLPVYEAHVGDVLEFEAETQAVEPYLSRHYDYAYSILTNTLNGSVGMQGFVGSYMISNPDEIVEIIVQFITPPAVGLRLMDERAITPQRIGRELSVASFEEQALSAHDAFSQQLNSIPVPFGRGGNMSMMEIFSAHHTLFNGVYMRVPGYMVGLIAALPEVFAVTPNVTFYTPTELEQPQLMSYPQNEIWLHDDFYATDLGLALTGVEANDSPFIYSNFMWSVRDYLHLDYVHNVMGLTGAGVRVAVLDSGIFHYHQEFERFLDETGRIRGWERYCNMESSDHGTRVSGAVIGVAPGIELWSYRIQMGHRPGMPVIAAIEAAHEDGIDIINMSFSVIIPDRRDPSTFNPFNPISQVVNLATLDGIVMVAAAHNYGSWDNHGSWGNYTITSPGNASLGITVGAGLHGGNERGTGFPGRPAVPWRDLPNNDLLWSMSSHGPTRYVHHIKPDILAPTYVITTHVGNFGYRANYTTSTVGSGTSFSAPIIAGIAALLLERFPDATPIEIKARLMNTARPLADMIPNSIYNVNSVFEVGAGFVQPIQALRAETIVTARHNVPNVPLWVNPAEMASLSFGLLNLHYSTGMNQTMPVSIRNTGNSAVTYTITHMFTRNGNNAAGITLSNTTVTVPAGNTGQFNVAIQIDGNRVPTLPVICNGLHCHGRGCRECRAFYDGYIYVRNGATIVARLPFGAVVKNEPTHTPTAQLHRVYNELQFRYALSQQHFSPIIIEVAADFTMISPLFNPDIAAGANVTIRGADRNIRTIETTNNNHLFSVGGNLTLENIRIINGGERTGSGIIVGTGGHLTILNGTVISGNRSSGIAVMGGNVTMHGGEISGNRYSGVLINAGIFNMYGGIITGNTADNGGGVAMGSGAFNMHGGEITGNTATHGGGIGISIDNLRSGMLRIGPGAVFSNNTALNSRDRLPEDYTAYNAFISTTQWTQPFTHGLNNFDIQNVHGIPVPMRRLMFHLNSTAASPTYPQHITPVFAPPGIRVMQTLMFPANPTRLGYHFAGWYLDSNFTQRLTPETIMPEIHTDLHARWLPLYVVFHFDSQVVRLRAANGYINTSQIPTPATRYGRPGQPGWAHMGWFTRIFDNMHYTANPNRAFAFDLTQRITHDMADASGHLHLHASFLRYGDVNGDGRIDPVDRTLVQNILLGLSLIPHYAHRQTADVDVDGWVTPVDRSLLNNHILGAPGVVLGVPDPNIILGAYLISFNFDMQTIDIPIANGRIDTTRITEEELLIWEMELLNFLYTTSGRSRRAAGLFVYVNELHSGNSYMLELDTSAFNMNMPTLALEISTLEQEMSAMATGTRR